MGAALIRVFIVRPRKKTGPLVRVLNHGYAAERCSKLAELPYPLVQTMGRSISVDPVSIQTYVSACLIWARFTLSSVFPNCPSWKEHPDDTGTLLRSPTVSSIVFEAIPNTRNFLERCLSHESRLVARLY